MNAVVHAAWLATGAVMLYAGATGMAIQVSLLADRKDLSGARLAAACRWIGVDAALLVLGALDCARVVFG